MAEEIRPKPTRMTVCDLCNKEIEEPNSQEVGSILKGYLAHPVTEKTKWAWLRWPTPEMIRKGITRPMPQRIQYDFHAECILRLVEDAIEKRVRRDA